jgi:alkanesulfonate monooxygenase SsuD/methylene tetrahydromethanopterin reductase-like flavin-dependent oxidoreductase (luciferase family)
MPLKASDAAWKAFDAAGSLRYSSRMSRPCRVGVQLPEIERVVQWPELRSMARTAEAAGFDSLWVGDHLLYDLPGGGTRGPWEAWTSLAALAAVTERVELGPLVASAGFHAPAMLAKQAATVDAISGGRLILGLGAGWNEREYRAFGFAYDHRVSRFEEAFTIIRGLLREGRVDFDGAYYRVEDGVLDPRPVRPGGPPLMLGSVRPRMLGIGLPHVDAWNVWWSDYGNTVEGFAAVREQVDAAAVLAGRAPGEVDATAAVLVRLPGGSGRLMGDTYNALVPPVQGSSADIAGHLAALATAGASHLQLVVDPITEASIEILAGALAVLDGDGPAGPAVG